MRVLNLIFSLYITLLAFVPCQDNFPFVSNDAPTAVHAHDSEHEHPEEQHEDHCTPFCICACCGAILDTPPRLLTLAEEDPLPPKGNTQPNATRNLHPGIFAVTSWQPPRVA